MKPYFDVIIIGGGATGAGIFRDLTLRGFKTLLLEKKDIAYGTSGRNHGLLHSGARYAVKDKESAKECINENKILKKIAFHCIEDTGGFFVSLERDSLEYYENLLKSCKEIGISTEILSPKVAIKEEPNLNPNINGVIFVPDGTIDPFRLVSSNVLDGKERGGIFKNYFEVFKLIIENNKILGVKGINYLDGKEESFFSDIVINAGGPWADRIAKLAGIDIKMLPSKGSMVIIDYRVNNIVINRCRPPSDGDIIVPGETVSIIGTTSKKITNEDIEEITVSDDEIESLLNEAELMIPKIKQTRLLRAYSGVRPLMNIGGEGRDISRTFSIINHESDGVFGFLSITGGKLMTYRLMAEKISDLVCLILKKKKKCLTATTSLPGSEKRFKLLKNYKTFYGVSESIVASTLSRLGTRTPNFLKKNYDKLGVICECELITLGEIEQALKNLDVHNLIDLRRRTRLGMGPCQGTLCALRALSALKQIKNLSIEETNKILIEFIEERWKGIKPVLWGDGLRQMEFCYWIYEGLLGVSQFNGKKI